MIRPDLAPAFSGRRVLITGGLGFIGSNLARELLELGAVVTIVDSLVPEYGGLLYNVAGIEDRLTVNISDVRDEHSVRYLVRNQDVLFNLAGQTSHLDSMTDPFTDLEINARSQLAILEACRHENPDITVVFASTRQLYGRPQRLPVDESHPVAPVDVNGINKAAGEWYHLLYGDIYGIRTSVLRLTNTYGPRMRVRDSRQTFLGIWIRHALADEEIVIYGDGSQRRDLTYVDDAIAAFLLAATREEAAGRVYNLGGDGHVSLLELGEMLTRIAGSGRIRLIPFPEDRKAIDIGDFYADYSAIESELGWRPAIGLEEGLARTLEYYREHGERLRSGRVRVPYLDLARETASVREELDAAIARVLDSGHYILSDEVDRFESAFATACAASHAVGVASGTDAITIALLAAGVGPGGEVITAANTCIPTIVGIERAGATPVLADVDPATYTLDPAEVERRMTPRTKAIVPVHLYGQPADLKALLALGIPVVEDCAQAHGATVGGKPVGSFGVASAFSFYPTKNLGALGDAGAVVTQSAEIAGRARLLHNYGERERFEHVLRGLNSRLDPIQAAVLSVKLGHLHAGVERRRRLAAIYDEALAGTQLTAPATVAGRDHAYHLYVVQAPNRDRFRAALYEEGIGTAVHYPTPLHRQPAYRDLDVPGGFPVAESLCERVVSLPLSETHTDEEIGAAAEAAAELSAT